MKKLFFNAKMQKRGGAKKNVTIIILFLNSFKIFAPLRLCTFAIFLLLTAHCSLLTAQSLPLAAPQTVGMSAEKLNQIDSLVARDIADKKLPGAVVLVGHK